jgi:uncharacterized protein YlxW (UPF0749 family)
MLSAPLPALRRRPAHSDDPRPRPIGRGVTRLAFELVVIFIGVSAAFFVENYRQEQQKRTQQVYGALMVEVGEHAQRLQELQGEIRKMHEWAAILHGEMENHTGR